MPISDRMNLVANLTVSFSDGYFTDAAQEPAGEQSSWTKVDARVGLEAPDGRWSIAIVGRNLGNEKVLGASQTFFNPFLAQTVLGYLEPPRTVALQLGFRFGG